MFVRQWNETASDDGDGGYAGNFLQVAGRRVRDTSVPGIR